MAFLCDFVLTVRRGQCAGVQLCADEERPARFVEDGVVREDGHNALASPLLCLTCTSYEHPISPEETKN